MTKKNKKLQPKEMYTTVEVARIMGVTPRTVQLWADAGMIKVSKTPGGHRRITTEDLEAFLLELDKSDNNKARQKKLKVLVAEDEPDIRKLYQMTLSSWDLPLEILTAKDGHEALILLGQSRPDILIVDLNMPRLDGFHMVRVLRENPDYDHMTIIVVSALSRKSIEDRGGLPEDVIIHGKPIPFEDLEKIFRDRIESSTSIFRTLK